MQNVSDNGLIIIIIRNTTSVAFSCVPGLDPKPLAFIVPSNTNTVNCLIHS